MRSLIFSKSLPALHSSRYLVHHQSSSIVEDEHDPFSLVADELSLLGNKLRAMVVAEVPKLASAAEYFFKMGVEGKRFRPTVLLLMSTALNLPIHEGPPPIDLGGALTSDVRTRQQRIAEITEMIHGLFGNWTLTMHSSMECLRKTFICLSLLVLFNLETKPLFVS
uniref:Prenyl transferase n=1 Tax=Cajanus cajan TaxID=3821 RepID=A0A151QZP4_CAJCA|nr:Prenyl transferase [Cajanus cajan]